MLDGNGSLHERKCGLATHFGVLLGIRTIGCSKKRTNISNINI